MKSLKYFIIKSKIIKLYREYLKTANSITDKNISKEIISAFKPEFKNLKNIENAKDIELQLQHLHNNLNNIKNMINFTK